MDLNKIIALSLGLIVAACILPTAVVMITNATAWAGSPDAVITLLPVIGIIAVIALIVMVVKGATN